MSKKKAETINKLLEKSLTTADREQLDELSASQYKSHPETPPQDFKGVNFELADSNWPRTGYDRRNRSHVEFEGGSNGEIALEVSLPSYNPHRVSGCVISDDGNLRVVCGGVLFSVSLSGKIFWSLEVKESGGKTANWYSIPVALKNGLCGVGLRHSVVIVDEAGKMIQQISVPDQLDDSGVSPNVSHHGQIIVSSLDGPVFSIHNNLVKEIGSFGNDIVVPAIYGDDSLAVSGYSESGFCRVRLDGERVWKTDYFAYHETDLAASINSQGITAVGSRNDGVSLFYSNGGELLGRYRGGSIFAEFSQYEWIALSVWILLGKKFLKLTFRRLIAEVLVPWLLNVLLLFVGENC